MHNRTIKRQVMIGNPLGKYIRKRRRDLNISQEDLAVRMTANGYRCAQSTVKHWESDIHPPLDKLNFASALAKSLEVKYSDILQASQLTGGLSEEDLRSITELLSPLAVKLLNQATPDDLRKIEAIILIVLGGRKNNIDHG